MLLRIALNCLVLAPIFAFGVWLGEFPTEARLSPAQMFRVTSACFIAALLSAILTNPRVRRMMRRAFKRA